MRDRRSLAPNAGPDQGGLLFRVLDSPPIRSLWQWASTGYRPFGIAILIAGLLWFAYAWYGSVAFTSADVSVSSRFTWETLAVPTIALAFVIGALMAPARGFVTDALLVATVIGGLLLGTALGAGLDGAAAQRAFGVFTVGTIVVTASAWFTGWAIETFRRRGGWTLPSAATYIVISVVLAIVIVMIVLPLFRPATTDLPGPTLGRAIQSTAAVRVSIGDVRWNAPPHYFLPRNGDRTVALQVGYKTRVGGTSYSRADWVARDAEGVTSQASVWPNRRPLRKIGTALQTGVLPKDGAGAEGWIAFVVPLDTRWLDVVFQQLDSRPLHWRVDLEGARVREPNPGPTPDA